MPSTAFGFDATDGPSIIAHAKKLENRTIREIVSGLEPSVAIGLLGKGRVGQVLQTWFGVDKNDNKPAADLPLARFPGSEKVGLEIKIVPMRSKGAGLRTKERTVVGNINYKTLPAELWRDASVRKKLEHVLFIYYLHDPDWLDARVLKVHHWTLGGEPRAERIRLDWKSTRDKVAAKKAHELHEGDTEILRTCRHGVGGAKEKPIQEPDWPKPAWRRAFALKPGHLDLVWLRDVQAAPVISLLTEATVPQASPRDLPLFTAAIHTSDAFALVRERLSTLEGKRLRDLDPRVDWSRGGKSAAALVIRKALGDAYIPTRIEEFIEEQLTIRVLPVAEKGRGIEDWVLAEACSFPAMNLVDFAQEIWETSELKSYLNAILFIPTLIGRRAEDQGDRKVGRAFFWRPNEDEWRGIEAEWRRYQEQVKSGACKTKRVGKRNISSLAKESQTKFIHMRPHGRDGKDMDVDPLGHPIVKQCFWLNKAFLKELLVKAYRSS